MPLAQEPSNIPRVVTRHESENNQPAVTRHKKLKLPKDQASERPPKIEGYHWRKKGAGWECRADICELDEATGATIRRQPYIAYLGKARWETMRAQHKGERLRRELAQWVEDQKARKGIS
jgi:hypothetical protein